MRNGLKVRRKHVVTRSRVKPFWYAVFKTEYPLPSVHGHRWVDGSV